MELRHIRYFMAVAEEGSVTRAASRLGIAQPPLSQQIRQLEREVGAPLFERLSRGVTLTEAGRRFLRDARDILERVNQALSNARLAALGELGTIRIGFTSSASFNPFVTGAIRAYRSAYPDVKVELIENNTAYLLAGLRTARVDVAFLRPAEGELTVCRIGPCFKKRCWSLYQRITPSRAKPRCRLEACAMNCSFYIREPMGARCTMPSLAHAGRLVSIPRPDKGRRR